MSLSIMYQPFHHLSFAEGAKAPTSIFPSNDRDVVDPGHYAVQITGGMLILLSESDLNLYQPFNQLLFAGDRTATFVYRGRSPNQGIRRDEVGPAMYDVSRSKLISYPFPYQPFHQALLTGAMIACGPTNATLSVRTIS